jgi:mRNA interferase MazF
MIERGAIYRLREKGDYTGKARPVVVMQNPNVQLGSVIVVLMTSNDSQGEPIRIAVDPASENGLEKRSYVMCDKVAAICAENLVEPPIGTLPVETLKQIQDTIYDLIDEGVSLN